MVEFLVVFWLFVFFFLKLWYFWVLFHLAHFTLNPPVLKVESSVPPLSASLLLPHYETFRVIST